MKEPTDGNRQVDELEDFVHYHRTCQRCGKNWWGLHCPHDGYQNPCPECQAMPVVLNAHYCDCEFVAEVSQIQVLVNQKCLEAIRVIGYRLDNRMDFNQNKIAWEVIDEYQAQLQSQLKNRGQSND